MDHLNNIEPMKSKLDGIIKILLYIYIYIYIYLYIICVFVLNI